MFKYLYLFVSLSVVFLFSSCASRYSHRYYGLDSEAVSDEPMIVSSKKASVASDDTSASGEKNALLKNRMIIYTADIYLLVNSLDNAQKNIKKLASNFGGYMQSMDKTRIVLRIPAKKFNLFIASLNEAGKVTNKRIDGEDVTEHFTDLKIRLDNALNLRNRYNELLKKAVKVEDMLKIEKALGEITEKVERMKGRMRYLKNRIDLSTVTVHLNAAIPQKDIEQAVPIEWVREIGSDIGDMRQFSKRRYTTSSPVDLTIPKSFVKLSGNSYRMTAMSPNDVFITLKEEDGAEGGTLDFWSTMIKKSLEKKFAVKVLSELKETLNTGWKCRILFAEKHVGTQTYSYMVAVVVYKKQVYLYEVWGDTKEFALEKENIIISVKSMGIGTFMQKLFSPSLW